MKISNLLLNCKNDVISDDGFVSHSAEVGCCKLRYVILIHLFTCSTCWLSAAVASQCLESAYGISIRDVDAVTLYPLPGSLQQIFSAGLSQVVGIYRCFFSLVLFARSFITHTDHDSYRIAETSVGYGIFECCILMKLCSLNSWCVMYAVKSVIMQTVLLVF